MNKVGLTVTLNALTMKTINLNPKKRVLVTVTVKNSVCWKRMITQIIN